MASELDVLFYIGILVPTSITVGFFIGFLVCWFRCNLRTKLAEIRQRNLHHQHQPATAMNLSSKTKPETNLADQLEKASQHSADADSAIDLREVELCPVEETNVSAARTSFQTSSAQIKKLVDSNTNQKPKAAAHEVGQDDCDYNLSKGSYPSYEKLDEEIHSEPHIYESQEDINIAMFNGFLNTRRCNQLRDVSKRRPHIHSVPQPAMLVHAVPAIITLERTSQHLQRDIEAESDYGFKTWRSERCSRPSSLASVAVIPTTPPKPARLEWKPYLTYKPNMDSYSVEIMHV